MKSVRRSGVIFALACALTGSALAATPAQAQPTTGARPTAELPGSALVLSVVPHQQSADQIRVALLRCDVDGGSHSAAAAACDDLEAASGDIDTLAVGDEICTFEYAPVTATAVGVWHDRLVSYHATFPNRCVLLKSTGDVFNF